MAQPDNLPDYLPDSPGTAPKPEITIEKLTTFKGADLSDLCDALEATIESGEGFGWLHMPGRDVTERYWKGVIIVPERTLVVARIDNVICGAGQLVALSRYNEARNFAITILASFIAPWARGHNIGAKMLSFAEACALEMGYKAIKMDLRETQTAAIKLFEKHGYKRWGTNPCYAFVDDKMIAGHYYNKIIDPAIESITD